LAVLGGALGALLAVWGVHTLVEFVARSQTRPLGFDITVDGRVLAFTTAMSLLVGIVFGLAPAFRATRIDLAQVLKDAAGGSAAASTRVRLRRLGMGSALVVAQVALSILVLVGAGLLVRTVANLRGVDPGFHTDHVLLFDIDPTRAGYKHADIDALNKDLRRELADLPGVTSATYSAMRLLSGGLWMTTLRLTGEREPSSMSADIMSVGPDFFDTLSIATLAGRTLTTADIAAAQAAEAAIADLPARTAPAGVAAMVVNEKFAGTYFPARSPIGETVQYKTNEVTPTWQIVGVVRNTKYNDLRREEAPTVYVAASGA